MVTNHKYFVFIFLLGYIIFPLTGCQRPSNPDGDTTAPVFAQVIVRLEAPTSPNPRGEFDITSQNVTREELASDLALRVIAIASDDESGIKDVQIVGELNWRCAFGRGSEIRGVFETAPLPFQPSKPPTPSPRLWQIDTVASPVLATGCNMNDPGHGPIEISGFVRVVATNGKDLTATSNTFVFDYADIGIER